MNEIPISVLRDIIEYNGSTGEFRWLSDDSDRWIRGWAAGQGYLSVKILGKTIKAHRLAFALYTGSFPTGPIDHINGDRADNRIENLRVASNGQNKSNSIKQAGRDLPKGVYVVDKSNKFQAAIKSDKKRVYLGVFNTVEEAAHAYNKAAVVIHGEYARLNPIGSDKYEVKS